MSRRRSALAPLTIGAAIGVATWVLSPWLAGTTEPWDAEPPLWPLTWVAVALIGGLTGHARGVLVPVGCAVGQMIASLPLGLTSEFGLLGWVFVVLACGAAVLSTLLVASATALIRHAGRPRPSCED